MQVVEQAYVQVDYASMVVHGVAPKCTGRFWTFATLPELALEDYTLDWKSIKQVQDKPQ